MPDSHATSGWLDFGPSRVTASPPVCFWWGFFDSWSAALFSSTFPCGPEPEVAFQQGRPRWSPSPDVVPQPWPGVALQQGRPRWSSSLSAFSYFNLASLVSISSLFHTFPPDPLVFSKMSSRVLSFSFSKIFSRVLVAVMVGDVFQQGRPRWSPSPVVVVVGVGAWGIREDW